MRVGTRTITRTRPTLSCAPCKRRKVKCDKQQPICKNCQRLGEECLYDKFPRQNDSLSDIRHAEGVHTLKRPRNSQDLADSDLRAETQERESSPHELQEEQGEPQEQGEQQQQQPQPPRPSQVPHTLYQSHGLSPTSASAVLATDNSTSLGGGHDNLLGGYDNDVDLDLFSFSNDAFAHGPDAASADLNCNHRNASRGDYSFGQNTTAVNSSIADLESLLNEPRNFESRFNPLQVSRSLQKLATPHIGREITNDAPQFPPHNQIPPLSEVAKIPGYLSAPKGPLRRYVGGSFWALAGNRMAECDLLLQAQQTQVQLKQADPARLEARSELLKGLPPKRLADLFVDSFFLSVRPLLPLVHEPTFCSRYDSFWNWYSENSSSPRTESMGEDETFPCLLWAVLFCGAVATTPTSLRLASSQIRDMSALLSRLRTNFDLTLQNYDYTDLPSFDGLVGVLLTYECDPFVDEIISSGHFVAQALQAAKSLGIQYEETVCTLGEVEGEIARRIWFHILQVEVAATISSGNTLSPGSHSTLYTTRMPRKVNDKSLGSANRRLSPADQYDQASTAMLLFNARAEMSRIMRQILEKCFDMTVPNTEDLSLLTLGIEEFARSADGFTAQLEFRGLPDQGHIPHQLLTANPWENRELYDDSPYKENVFNAFAAILLSMMKDWVSTLFNRRFLSQACDHQLPELWRSQAGISSHFLRNYLNLARLPAFEPYRWLCPAKNQPLQECIIVLTYLKDNSDKSDSLLLKYLLEEIFDIFEPGEDPGKSKTVKLPLMRRYESSWKLLRRFKREVFASFERSTTQRRSYSLQNEFSSQSSDDREPAQRAKVAERHGSISNSYSSPKNFSNDVTWLRQGEDMTAAAALPGRESNLSMPGSGRARLLSPASHQHSRASSVFLRTSQHDSTSAWADLVAM